MPYFSAASLDKLDTCHVDLKTLFLEVIKYFNCTILEGYRNKIDQEKAFAAGNTKLHYPMGKHNHMPSYAVDVAPYPVPEWKNVGDFLYFGGFVMGIAVKLLAEGRITHKIRYGGDFNSNKRVTDQSFLDCVHFEVVA